MACGQRVKPCRPPSAVDHLRARGGATGGRCCRGRPWRRCEATSSGSSVFTLPWVPTGMKIGVSTSPCARRHEPGACVPRGREGAKGETLGAAGHGEGSRARSRSMASPYEKKRYSASTAARYADEDRARCRRRRTDHRQEGRPRQVEIGEQPVDHAGTSSPAGPAGASRRWSRRRRGRVAPGSAALSSARTTVVPTAIDRRCHVRGPRSMASGRGPRHAVHFSPCMGCSSRSSTVTGWKVPRPDVQGHGGHLAAAHRQPAEQRTGQVQTGGGRGDGAIDPGEDRLVALRVALHRARA